MSLGDALVPVVSCGKVFGSAPVVVFATAVPVRISLMMFLNLVYALIVCALCVGSIPGAPFATA